MLICLSKISLRYLQLENHLYYSEKVPLYAFWSEKVLRETFFSKYENGPTECMEQKHWADFSVFLEQDAEVRLWSQDMEQHCELVGISECKNEV